MRAIDLSGQTAIVTGAAGGLGKAMSRALAEAGATVWLWDISEAALDLAAAVINLPDRIRTALVDVSSSISIANGAAKASAAGPVEILINNVGISTPFPGLNEPEDHFIQVLDVNLVGQQRCCQALMPGMIERGYGRVVNISSAAATMAFAHHASYNASKAGVIALTKTLGKEYGAKGVAVNCVVPGYFDTPLYQVSRQQMKHDPETPINRIGRPEELAELVLWLSSPLCSYTIGATFDCSGGIAV